LFRRKAVNRIQNAVWHTHHNCLRPALVGFVSLPDPTFSGRFGGDDFGPEQKEEKEKEFDATSNTFRGL